MLQSLIIKNFVIVEHLELNFEDGFTVFTGETGAGKSMIIDALALLLGKRATTLKIREGSEKAEITAFFKISSPKLKELLLGWCQQFGFDFDSNEIFIRRVIEKSGKSRAWINGHNSSVNQVKEIGEWLMEIHSQNAHQKLLIPEYQRKILDDFANIKSNVEQLKQLWDKWSSCKVNLSKAREKNQSLEQLKIQANWKMSLIENLNLHENEWVEVSSKEKKLSVMAEILSTVEEALNLFQQSDGSIISKIEKLQKRISNLTNNDKFFEQISKSIEQSLIELKDATDNLSRYLGQNDLDPHAYQQASERLSEIFHTSQKIGCKPEELEGVLDQCKSELLEIEAKSNLEALISNEKKLQEKYFSMAKFISEQRINSAKSFQALVSDWLKKLAMESTELYVEISKKYEASPSGLDEVNFKIKHTGIEKVLKISKIASGGELSRISLAISVVMANASKTPSLIFDEVDAGIGGNTAHIVGKLLDLLGKDQQILCVTHLPQIAAKGHSHFSISKTETNNLPTSLVRQIEDVDRVEEIARMLGSKEQLNASVIHAKALLNK